MAKRGPKTIEIDWASFDKLCGLQCTLEEIASFFNCSADTIERCVKRVHKMKFAELYAQKAQRGRISIRRQQFQVAEKGNVTMLIWLGKQYLNQSDTHKLEHSGSISPSKLSEIEFKRVFSDPKVSALALELAEMTSKVSENQVVVNPPEKGNNEQN